MTTMDEFNKITQIMYDEGYVMVNLYDLADVDENGKMQAKQVYLPKGKTPFVLSQDDVCSVTMPSIPKATPTHSTRPAAPTSILLLRYFLARWALFSLVVSAIMFSFFSGLLPVPGRYAGLWSQYSIFFPLCKGLSCIGCISLHWVSARCQFGPQTAPAAPEPAGVPRGKN